MEEKVVLVNPNDDVLGVMEKMQAHQNGLLHRAFSVFLFDQEGKMLLQQRSSTKYHSLTNGPMPAVRILVKMKLI